MKLKKQDLEEILEKIFGLHGESLFIFVFDEKLILHFDICPMAV